MHCGKPFDRMGVTVALTDCPDHVGQGAGAVLENFLSTGAPVGFHDPVGWPTFKDWPRHDSLTHEQTYYKWIERAWKGGMKIQVNLLVENEVLCDVYPAEEEPLRRHELDPAPGARRLPDAGLHRRAERRAREGLVPDRDRPVRGAAGDQRRQARGGARRRDLRAVRLQRPERPPNLRRGPDRQGPRRVVRARRARHGAGQQVRQRAGGRGLRQRPHRRRHQRGQQAEDRRVLEGADLYRRRPRPPPDARPGRWSRPPPGRRAPSFGDPRRAHAASIRRRPTATPWGSRLWAPTRSRG